MHKINFQSNHNSQEGFTLIELMVSLTLFIIVVVALIGSLYTVNDASRRVQAMRTIMDNVNFAIENISRNVRTSQNLTCGLTINCPITNGVPSDTITMISTLGKLQYIKYSWVKDLSTGNGKIVKTTAPVDYDPTTQTYTPRLNESVGPVNITAPEIDIQNARFYVDGVGQGDNKQPSVMVKFEGVAKVSGTQPVPFAIQTYLSQRSIE